MGMSVSVSVKDSGRNAPQWDIDLDLNGEASLKDFESNLRYGKLQIAKEVLSEEQASGFDSKPRKRVGGRWDIPEETAGPYQSIEYYSRVEAVEVVLNIYSEIEKRSLYDTGQYKAANYVFMDNKLIATDRGELALWYAKTKNEGLPSGAVIRFINVTPYAARLEYHGYSKSTRGKTKGQRIGSAKKRKSRYDITKMVKKPNGAYVLAFRASRSKFKQAAGFMKFAFIPNGYNGISVQSGGRFRTTYAPGNKNGYTGPYIYPSIVLNFNEKGTVTPGAIQ